MNNPTTSTGKTVPMRTESVNFTDGMIVTAHDLGAAMAYPVALMQSVNKAVFGCGVVCGLEIRPESEVCHKVEPSNPGGENSKDVYPSLIVEIVQGTALDCSGLPVELCSSIPFDLGNPKCGCDVKEGEVCIYIRRVTSKEAPRADCCDTTGGPVQCTRHRDHVEIRAFPQGKGPQHACMRVHNDKKDVDKKETKNKKETAYPTQDKFCECLKKCTDCGCCGEGWILLGCLEVSKAGIVKTSFDSVNSNRRWIKTIDCLCPAVELPVNSADVEQFPTNDRLKDRKVDPDIEKKMLAIVQSKERVATFMLAGVINMEHFSLVLEEDYALLLQAFGLSTPERIEEWKKKAKS